tara:strand:- start:2875 stop:3567 length:693 start_codon:yes stop_codon:yes gene_type:complete
MAGIDVNITEDAERQPEDEGFDVKIKEEAGQEFEGFDINIVTPEDKGLSLPGVTPEPELPEPQARVKLKIRKTLDGSFVIFDHPDIDIVIMPQMFKIMAFAKDQMGDHIYATQSRLFDFLMRRGTVVLDSVQGGNLYGSLEGNIPPVSDPNIDPIDVAIYVIAKFIDEEKPYYDREEKYKDDVDDWMLEPEDDHSTDIDWAVKTHQPRKGVQNRWPGSAAAYGLTGMYRA